MAVVPLRRPTSKAEGYKFIRNAAATNAEIYIYGPIGMSWFGDGVSANQFRQDLSAAGKVKTIDLHINSEGGDVFDAQAIYTLLLQHPATVTVHIDGLAASAASFIAMCGKTIEIGESAFMMVHNASGGCFGEAKEMRQTADLFDSICLSMAKLYSDRTKQTVAECTALMNAETWMNGTDAVAKGFADKCVANMTAVAACVRDPSKYSALPAALRPNRSAAITEMNRLSAKFASR